MIIIFLLLLILILIFLITQWLDGYKQAKKYYRKNGFFPGDSPIIKQIEPVEPVETIEPIEPDEQTQTDIIHLQQLKTDYLKLYDILETDYLNGKIKRMQYQNKKIAIDKQIYNIDKKLNKLLDALE